MSTPISVVGTIATDPRFVQPPGGSLLCSFRVASNERRYDRERGTWVDGETNWFTVTAFRSLADHASRSLRKGDRVVVVGRLRVRKWETEEKSGTAVEVDAEALGHDLRWGVTQFAKQLATNTDAESESPSGPSLGFGRAPEPGGQREADPAASQSSVTAEDDREVAGGLDGAPF